MRVLVVGDIISDVYTECYFKKMCPDAPTVPAMVRMSSNLIPGGAANVALNLLALAPADVVIDLVGVYDLDMGYKFTKECYSAISLHYGYSVGEHNSLKKERFIMDGKLVARVDQQESIAEKWLVPQQKMLRYYFEEGNRPDLILFSDYAGGAMALWECIPQEYRSRCIVDTKQTDLSVFEGCWMIKLNRDELNRVFEAGEATPEKYCQGLVTTLGRDGAVLHAMGPHRKYPVTITHTMSVNAHRVIPVDPCGCGDTFLAGLAASLLSNGDMFTAVQFANAAAATVVTEPHVAVADLGRTLGLLGRGSDEISERCTDRDH